MAAPANRKWKAWINVMPGASPAIHVTGEVETRAGNLVPKLKMTVPQGINPAILMLDLTIVKKGDVGTDDVAYRKVAYRKPARKGQYTEVDIFYEKSIITRVKVTEAN
ncbi:hypothetical protein [Mesorhizobium sp. 113-3-3]|uniref:hypothetical protein n=1 Tax=Mesorhizobium sp. 113-3-3 TaxID=2744516 RepID=UPI0019292B18|nr:hypothetical protein [Mesorhizobium sp. 113-3-3]BCG76537.1 hypothetical protein MesoLj113b_00790 [Mesorhizobium sp. 113-3-3]